MDKGKKTKNSTQSVRRAAKKETFLISLANNNGNITNACIDANIGRRTYYDWLEDEKFAENVENVQESLLDLAESKLMENINKNDNTSIIFFLKTKGKKRGYIEKQEVDANIRPIEGIDFEGI